jgi:microcystin-dependent protein
MSQPYIGEIRMFGSSFAPAGWAFCNGQLIPISQNDALFVLLGTIYGGDGQETFALPDLQGRLPMHQGQGPGLSQNYIIGEKAGVESVTLTTQQIPLHTHPMVGSGVLGISKDPVGNTPSNSAGDVYIGDNSNVPLSPQAVTPIGGSQPHENLQPYLAVSFIISLFGIFPTQN